MSAQNAQKSIYSDFTNFLTSRLYSDFTVEENFLQRSALFSKKKTKQFFAQVGSSLTLEPTCQVGSSLTLEPTCETKHFVFTMKKHSPKVGSFLEKMN